MVRVARRRELFYFLLRMRSPWLTSTLEWFSATVFGVGPWFPEAAILAAIVLRQAANAAFPPLQMAVTTL